MASHNWNKNETLIYAALWTLLFITPVFSLYIRSTQDEAIVFHLSDLMSVWRLYAIFLAIFLLHNYLLAPLLVYRQRRVLYFSCIAGLLAVFTLVQCISRPDEDMPPRPFDDEFFFDDMPPMPFDDGPDGHEPRLDRMPPPVYGQHDVVATIILILMLGMNIGVKLYFKQRSDQMRMATLEKDNLEQQLEYLKYQINPHFLMNTLNNIHALVDIDPERAKESIVILSKIMRFALYEGNKRMVPVSREVEFMQNYIQLMRMRYTDKVDIGIDIADNLPDMLMPPMMFITFVENAFKHGVSYQQPSFIDISITADADFLVFRCDNSKIDRRQQQHGGVGLQNVKRRLELIYGDRCMLRTDEQAETFNVELKIPLS